MEYCLQYANMHIVFIWVFCMLKLYIKILYIKNLKSKISNGF
ncbi:serine kinase [Bacillus cereus]|nr:serine kinase [Bacillus cereus]